MSAPVETMALTMPDSIRSQKTSPILPTVNAPESVITTKQSLTLSGALTVGKMGLVFCDLIESGIVKAIVSTGALMAHGLVEATGYSHFRYNPNMDDKELFHAGYNRVYDSLEPETNLDHVEEVMDHIFTAWDAEDIACSWKIHQRIGEYLHKTAQGRGILKSAFEHNVPIFVPAFSD